jgi:hypothetical protein
MQLPLNVSPVSASFFGFKRQGIHLVLCLACSHVSALVCFSVTRLPESRRATAVSSVSTRAVRPAQSAKLKEYPIQLVRCGLSSLIAQSTRLATDETFGMIIMPVTPTAGEWKPVLNCYARPPVLLIHFLSDSRAR